MTDFAEQDWYRVLSGAMEIESVILQQYDLIQEGLAGYPEAEGPFANEHHCHLIIGEWGNWHQLTAGASSALWQQSTMRDALTSAITLDIFHRNSDKLRAACVAQTVNVLNSLILTQGEHTILTPHYHVFDLYKVHRGGQILDLELAAAILDQSVPALFSFASEKDGVISVNLIHAQLAEEQTIEHPTQVCIQEGPEPRGRGQNWQVTLPAASVTVCQFRILAS